MQNVIDFMSAALPWIAIGLFLTVVKVGQDAKKEGKELTGIWKALTWTPMAAFVFVAIMEFAEGKTSSAVTWLVIGLANLLLNVMPKKQ